MFSKFLGKAIVLLSCLSMLSCAYTSEPNLDLLEQSRPIKKYENISLRTMTRNGFDKERTEQFRMALLNSDLAKKVRVTNERVEDETNVEVFLNESVSRSNFFIITLHFLTLGAVPRRDDIELTLRVKLYKGPMLVSQAEDQIVYNTDHFMFFLPFYLVGQNSEVRSKIEKKLFLSVLSKIH